MFTSHPETKAVQIPFVKKNESDFPKLKLTYFNKLTKKNEDFFMYDYIGDFEKFGLEWYQKDLKLYYGIKTDKTDNKKIEKRLSLERLTRKKICIDESRVWNMKNTWQKITARDNSRLTFLEGYLFNEQHLKVLIGITTSSYDFTSLNLQEKTGYLQRLTLNLHKGVKGTNSYNLSVFLSPIANLPATILIYILSQSIVRYTNRIKRLFVTRFYHDRKDRNFLKGLVYAGEKTEIDEIDFSELPVLGRKLYEYQIKKPDKNPIKPIDINSKDFDWPFPEKFYESIGFTVSGFSFEFKNAPSNLKSILNLPNDLINVESGIKQVENSLNEALFHVNKKYIKEKIAEYIAIPTKNFINESYFLYDKSNLIKKHLLLPLTNNCLSTVFFSYFSGKTAATNLKLLTSSNFLKFLFEKKSLKKILKLQLVHIDGSEVKTSNKKIHHFSITKLGKRRKGIMSEPIEAIIIRAQQDFGVVGGLNPVQIEIKDNRIINMLKNTKMSSAK